jgi:hypothetical protein
MAMLVIRVLKLFFIYVELHSAFAGRFYFWVGFTALPWLLAYMTSEAATSIDAY